MKLSETIRRPALLAALLFVAAFDLRAQNIDTVAFGDPPSEAAHDFDAHFPPPTPISQKYTNPPASDPSENPPSEVIDGALGLKARRLLSRSPVPDMNGGEITLTMKVDPINQNYFSVKLWGSDSNPGLLILYCNGFELGARHGLEATGLSFMLSGGAWLKDRFWYRTVRLPLYLTYGHTTATLSLRWTGNLNYYNNSSYVHYQAVTKEPSQPLYAAYTHVGSYVDTTGETEAPPPPNPPKRNRPGPEAIEHFKDDLNHNVADRLRDDLAQKNPNDLPKDAQFLAQSYEINWTVAHNNPEIIDRVVKIGDFLTTFYSTKKEVPGEGFGSGSGPFGNAIKLLWSQLQSRMGDTVDFGGTIGEASRGEGWGKLLRASIDDQRFNRKQIYNQECDGDFQLYMANQGLQLVDPSLALTETEALRYVKEGMGIFPWAGNDQPDKPNSPRPIQGTYPNGPNWYTSTSRGTLKDGAYMPTGDYGEQGPPAYNMWLLTGDQQIHARAIQIEKARLPFRFPSVDDGGFKVMTVPEPIGSRNKDLPGHDAYLTRDSGAVLVASENIPEFTGVFQEEIEDGQLDAFAVKQQVNRYFGPYMPDQLAAGLAQPPSSYRLPMADGRPDFAWGDEDNMVVAAKHGNERFFAALARDFVNGAAIVFEVTPRQAYVSEVQEDDVQFISSGQYIVPYGWVEQWDWAQPPDNDLHPNALKGRRQPQAIRPDMAGIDLASYHNQDGGRARSYTLRYGHFLVGMNMDARYNRLPYRVKTPADFVSGIDLVSGQKKTVPVIIPPGTTVVFYLPKTSSPNPPPASPLVFTGLAGNNLVNLDWDPSAGAQSYTIKRSETAGGPYTIIATGLNTLRYVDKTAVQDKTYYYILTGTGLTGESDPSPEIKITLPKNGGLVAPWFQQDIGKVKDSGATAFDGTVYTVTAGGDDIYQGPDSFHFVGQPVTGDCTITVQVKNQQGGNEWSKSGLMFRSSLDPNASMAALVVTPQHGVQWMRRGDGYRDSVIEGIHPPTWLRLSRKGTVITALTSSNGLDWTEAQPDDIPQLLPTIYIGLASTAHDNSSHVTATFKDVSITTP